MSWCHCIICSPCLQAFPDDTLWCHWVSQGVISHSLKRKFMQTNENNPSFARLPNESVKAFEAFTAYLGMGGSRSLEAVGQKLGKSRALMERWSKRHNWVARVDAHAVHMAALMRREEVQVVREFALERAKREEAQKESEWQARCELLALAREKITEWRANPKKLGTLEGIARLLELASKLGRLSVGMATDKTETAVAETHTLSVEFRAAVEKIYGRPVPPQFIDVESKPQG